MLLTVPEFEKTPSCTACRFLPCVQSYLERARAQKAAYTELGNMFARDMNGAREVDLGRMTDPVEKETFRKMHALYVEKEEAIVSPKLSGGCGDIPAKPIETSSSACQPNIAALRALSEQVACRNLWFIVFDHERRHQAQCCERVGRSATLQPTPYGRALYEVEAYEGDIAALEDLLQKMKSCNRWLVLVTSTGSLRQLPNGPFIVRLSGSATFVVAPVLNRVTGTGAVEMFSSLPPHCYFLPFNPTLREDVQFDVSGRVSEDTVTLGFRWEEERLPFAVGLRCFVSDGSWRDTQNFAPWFSEVKMPLVEGAKAELRVPNSSMVIHFELHASE
jgi:hypothetical protein